MQCDPQGLLQSQAFVSALVLLIVAFGAACSSCQVTRAPGGEPKLEKLVGQEGSPAASQSVLPSCPPTHRSPLQASPPGTGHHHQVTLSWIAAPGSSRPGGDVVGYCIYRSTTQDAVKQDPLCPLCERVNVLSVKGVSCIDDIVEDRTTYYYVVTAINGNGNISSPSNQAIAPVGDHPNSVPPSYPPPPSCRGASPAR